MTGNSALKPPVAPQRGKRKRPRTKDVEIESANINLEVSQTQPEAENDHVAHAVTRPDTNLEMDLQVPDEDKEAYKELFEAMARFDERGAVYVDREEQTAGNGDSNGPNATSATAKVQSAAEQKKRKDVLRDLPTWVVDPVSDFVSSGPRVVYGQKKQANWDSFVAALLCDKFERPWRRCLQRLVSGRDIGGDSGLVLNENMLVEAIVRQIIHLVIKPRDEALGDEVARKNWLCRVNTIADRQFIANEATAFSKLRIQHVVTLHLYLQEFRQLAQVNPAIAAVKDDVYARLRNVQQLAEEYDVSVNGNPTPIPTPMPLRDAVADLLTRLSSLRNRKQQKKKSRRQKKEESRGYIARLKSLAISPEVVDSWDVTAADPLLLVNLKAWPNSVRVPDIWRQKRKYLQNKRGMEKRPFILPSYISDLGIGQLRDTQLEDDAKKTLKQKQREKMRAKTGKGIEIDPLVLKDAFYKFQTKPKLTALGDLYYELRELEVDASRFRPGKISGALKAALGMREGDPPPWLVNMQRFGPPPGYADIEMVIPGLNAPIPRGAAFGYHHGGWGKPPVDINGRPIYGDVFGEGLQYSKFDPRFDMENKEKNSLWGEMKASEAPLGAVRKEKEVVEVKEEKDAVQPVVPPPIVAKPVEEAPPPTQVPLPLQEPPMGTGMELRKGVAPGQLYTVLEEKKRNVGQNEMHGSKHAYVIDGRETITDGRVTENPNLNSLSGGTRKRKEGGKESSNAKKQKTFKF